MKAKIMMTQYGFLLAAAIAAFAASGCSMNKGTNSLGLASTSDGTGPAPGVPTFSSAVPNLDSTTGRIAAILTPAATTASPSPSPLVNALSGNFKTALAQQGSNLSPTSNPVTAVGAGAVQLLSYAACSDIAASTSSSAAYGVKPSTSAPTAAVQTTIVNAGVTIVNNCTAGLAAAGTALNSTVTSTFTTLLASNAAASPAATTTQDWVSVCTAATSVCAGMLGF